MQFTHLHCHSHFSLLDGIAKINALVENAQSLGMNALALTDHGVMYGAIEFYNACKEAGIKPIIGMEAYIAPRTMEDKEGKIDSDYYHLTLLAKNYAGYLNLIKLTTEAHLRGFYYKPRIDKATLTKYADGIIALSGCMRGEVPRAVTDKKMNQAAAIVDEHIKIFGKDNFFIELQRSQTEDKTQETLLNERLLSLAKKQGVRVVATGDCHYIHREDAEAQDVAVCIGTGRTVDDADRLDMRGNDLSLKSPEQMSELFKDIPEAIETTEFIASQCEIEIPIDQRYFPKVELPPGKTAEEHLTETVAIAAIPLYGKDGALDPAITERINYELNIINQKGFAPYFLMVADIVRGAHELTAITNTRGSAAGSIVGKILGITNVDPLYYELPFERFMTMERPSPPDIDLDISDVKRDIVIDWIADRYGHDKVAQIITFGTMMARAAVRDVGRALGVAYGKCDRIAKMIPIGKQGFHMTLDKALDMNHELKSIYDQDPETKRILDIAKKLEGCARHASVHAAALVITPTELTDYLPLQKDPDGNRQITQYDMYALDAGANSKALGVVKMDLLGIRNLSILEEAVRLVKIRHKVDTDIYNLPHPDKKTFELLSRGLTFGVFQLGSSGITRYLKDLKPNTIFDIMAMIALYRPGPMQFIPDYIRRKHNRKLISYFDPALERILHRTYGILVYQDDLLIIAHDLAGYSWGDVDKFRKAVGKKIPAEMAKQKEKFIKGCMQTSSWSEQKATQVWTWIEPFAAYGFNKSHSASYAVVSYQTAYMKANFPVEFMAAVMTAESGDEAKIYAAVEECSNLGISVLPPDVSESYGDFTVVDDRTIRFGLNGIKNLGTDVVRCIIDARKEGKSFETLENFLLACYTKNFNKRSWEALVKAGALDRYGERGQLLANTEGALDFLRAHFKVHENGQNSLFGKSLQIGKLTLREVPPASKAEKLAWEKEHLGLYVSSHPLESYSAVLRGIRKVNELTDNFTEQVITMGGIIAKLKRTLTRKNDPMAFFTLEDSSGSVEVLVFPKLMPKAVELLELERVVQVTGRLTDKDGEFKLIADDIKELPNDETYFVALSELEKNKQVVIYMHTGADAGVLNDIKKVIEANPGNAQVYLQVGGVGQNGKRIKTKSQVRLSDELLSGLKAVPQIAMISEN